jgi:hypothetical protein
MNQKIKPGAIFTCAALSAFAIYLGLSFWLVVSAAVIGYLVGLDNDQREEAIKNGDDLSRWPKEKAKKDFQEWLNKH